MVLHWFELLSSFLSFLINVYESNNTTHPTNVTLQYCWSGIFLVILTFGCKLWCWYTTKYNNNALFIVIYCICRFISFRLVFFIIVKQQKEKHLITTKTKTTAKITATAIETLSTKRNETNEQTNTPWLIIIFRIELLYYLQHSIILIVRF